MAKLSSLESPLEPIFSGPEFSPIEEVINHARNGRMTILVDDSGGKVRGALILPAQLTTPLAVNFMATFARGLICLSLTRERADQLKLPMMMSGEQIESDSAFTVSIEARDGVSTGISAADRARTIVTAADPANGPEAIVTPGHVFPVVARTGGVLVRAAHAEAAVDITRLCGLMPACVICEIMSEDGSIAGLADLLALARCHDLRTCRIGDLIGFRLRFDRNLEEGPATQFRSRFGGVWRAISFRDTATGRESVALVKGNVSADTAAPIYIHRLDLFADALGEIGSRSDLLRETMGEIESVGSGAIVLLGRASSDSILSYLKMRLGDDLQQDENGRPYDEGNIGFQVIAALGASEGNCRTWQ